MYVILLLMLRVLKHNDTKQSYLEDTKHGHRQTLKIPLEQQLTHS